MKFDLKKTLIIVGVALVLVGTVVGIIVAIPSGNDGTTTTTTTTTTKKPGESTTKSLPRRSRRRTIPSLTST